MRFSFIFIFLNIFLHNCKKSVITSENQAKIYSTNNTDDSTNQDFKLADEMDPVIEDQWDQLEDDAIFDIVSDEKNNNIDNIAFIKLVFERIRDRFAIRKEALQYLDAQDDKKIQDILDAINENLDSRAQTTQVTQVSEENSLSLTAKIKIPELQDIEKDIFDQIASLPKLETIYKNRFEKIPGSHSSVDELRSQINEMTKDILHTKYGALKGNIEVIRGYINAFELDELTSFVAIFQITKRKEVKALKSKLEEFEKNLTEHQVSFKKFSKDISEKKEAILEKKIQEEEIAKLAQEEKIAQEVKAAQEAKNLEEARRALAAQELSAFRAGHVADALKINKFIYKRMDQTIKLRAKKISLLLQKEDFNIYHRSDLNPEESKLLEDLIASSEIPPRREALIGRGGFGSVYAVNFNDREFVVKVMSQSRPSDFLKIGRELAANDALPDNPALLRSYGAIKKDGNWYVVSDRISEDALSALKRGERPPYSQVEEMLGGLKEMHDAGIVHGDLKWENIFIDDGGNHYIADFGGIVHTQSEFIAGFTPGKSIGETEARGQLYLRSSGIMASLIRMDSSLTQVALANYLGKEHKNLRQYIPDYPEHPPRNLSEYYASINAIKRYAYMYDPKSADIFAVGKMLKDLIPRGRSAGYDELSSLVSAMTNPNPLLRRPQKIDDVISHLKSLNERYGIPP